MPTYIEREALKNAFCASCSTNKRYHRTNDECRSYTDSYGNGCFKMRLIDSVPSADVVERKRGEWESYISKLGSYVYYRCTVCGEPNPYQHTNRAFSNFCPNCGADMRGEKHEAD